MSYRYTIETENPIVTDGNKMYNCNDGKLRLKIVEANPWHTGTPTEEGEYLIKYRYPQNGMKHDVAQYPASVWKMNIIEKWQNIEETD